MTSMLALTLSATLSDSPVLPAAPPRVALLTQTQRLIEAPPTKPMVSATRAALPTRGGDSVVDGAVTGGLIAGAAAAVVLGYFCHIFNETGDPICVKQVAWRSAVAAAGGALIGAGIDALMDRQPSRVPRSRIRF